MSDAVGKFAVIIHPQSVSDFTKKFPFTRLLPAAFVERVFTAVPPFEASHITGIVSATGARAEGWFIGLPWTPRVLLAMPPEVTTRRLVQAGRIAERLGAGIVGLAAFTKVVGDRGVSLARALPIGVTTGNSLTAATAVEGAALAASRMGVPIGDARVAVIGATGRSAPRAARCSRGRPPSSCSWRATGSAWSGSPSASGPRPRGLSRSRPIFATRSDRPTS